MLEGCVGELSRQSPPAHLVLTTADGCVEELSRPPSPPEHLVLTTARLAALGPPLHVRAPRRFLMDRTPLSETSTSPPCAFTAFLGNVSAEAEKTTSLLSPSPVRRPATEASQAVLSSFFSAKKSLVPANLFKPKGASTPHKPSSRKSWKE